MQRILIVRLSAIGDVVMSTALLPPLRRKYPNAEIYWLTEEAGAEVLQGNTELTRVIVASRGRWKKLKREKHYGTILREILAVRQDLRALKPDLIIDAQGLLRSGLWAWAAGGKRRVGIGSREGSQYLMHEVVDAELNSRSRMSHEYRKAVEHLNLPGDPFELSLMPPPHEKAAALHAIPDGEARPLLLYPFTTRPQKHWFEERWAELAVRVHRELGHPVWVMGGPSDEAAAERISAGADGAVARIIAGRTSNLSQKMAIMERALAGVGVDTGLTHMSIGIGCPTVALFGSTCPYVETAPLPSVILYEWLECSPCRRHPTCNGAFTCMRNLDVDRTLSSLMGLIDAQAQDPAY